MPVNPAISMQIPAETAGHSIRFRVFFLADRSLHEAFDADDGEGDTGDHEGHQ